METLLQEGATAQPMGAAFNGPPPKRRRVEEDPGSGPFGKAFQGARQRKYDSVAHTSPLRSSASAEAFQ